MVRWGSIRRMATSVELVESLKQWMLQFISGHIIVAVAQTPKQNSSGAWATFLLAKNLSISSIHVMGDSKVIIEWLLNKGRLQVAALEGWKIRIKELTKLFRSIKYQHIYRDFNMEADKQSKLALEENEGFLYYHQWINGAEGPRKQIRIH
jgi:hypothetical protein